MEKPYMQWIGMVDGRIMSDLGFVESLKYLLWEKY